MPVQDLSGSLTTRNVSMIRLGTTTIENWPITQHHVYRDLGQNTSPSTMGFGVYADAEHFMLYSSVLKHTVSTTYCI